jgi:beta-glucosidase-like glycosyl hydrolase/CubicO group peptidase (beta-lactamase class C family)
LRITANKLREILHCDSQLTAMKKFLLLIIVACSLRSAQAQRFSEKSEMSEAWVNAQFNKLSQEERIAQLMIVRAHSNLGEAHIKEVTDLVTKYNVGGLCFFQGGPIRQAVLTNAYQSLAKTPLMIAIDGEWGLGMRLDSVINFPRQLMMGATNDARLVYQFGRIVGEQCKRLGIQVNYAPDVDINNNPKNPVINDRSFGEDKYKVAQYGVAYMRGMQDVNVMACAKHFPGHGDVAVDSHLDLPIILKSKGALDSLELYPFKEMIKAGVGSVMMAHLSIPAIDTTTNLPTSLSAIAVQNLLRNELGYNGITFTDALEMKGVAKFFPKGEASVQSLIAGNDMLCLPGDIAGSIEKVKEAIATGKLSWEDLNERVKKVLRAKYNLGLASLQPIDTTNLAADLNASTNTLKEILAKKALTLLKLENKKLLPLHAKKTKTLYVGIGINKENIFATNMKDVYGADAVLFDFTDSNTKADSIASLISGYDAVVVGLHNFNRRPANNFGISQNALDLLSKVQGANTINFCFGNPYAVANLCGANNIVVCYEDDEITQKAGIQLLQGTNQPEGKLPVTVCDNFAFGTGIETASYFETAVPEEVGMSSVGLQKIDSIANAAIDSAAIPGCVVLVAKNGKVVYNKAFGNTNYNNKVPMQTDMVFDLASVTKVSATTVAIMKLVESKKVKLNKTIGDYIPWVRGSDKASIKISDLLLHQAGLVPFISFYKEVMDPATNKPSPKYFSTTQNAQFSVRVAENVYLRNDWQDSMYARILSSSRPTSGKYVYSDNDFIFLGKVVESVTGMGLDAYVADNFYEPLGMGSTGFLPRQKMPLSKIVPTEVEAHFRAQQTHGDVHDEGAAMFGGVAGHAGLFSNAYDLAKLYQMLLNGGVLNGKRYLKKSTIQKFTAYNSTISRRGLGFDKPEKDNATLKEPYPSKSVSPETYGHTGFTGTCVWVDPTKQLVYIFLSSRVSPTRNNTKFGRLNVRPNIQEAIYSAIQ